MGVAATTAALRWVRDVGNPTLLLLLLLATLPATALALAVSSVLSALLEQLQELGHDATATVAASSTVATTSFAAFGLGLLRSSASTAIRARRITWHARRRPVVGVEPLSVLEGAEASASLGPQTAVVTVPRGLRSRILERQVGSVSERRAGRAPINRLGLQVEKAGTKRPTNSV